MDVKLDEKIIDKIKQAIKPGYGLEFSDTAEFQAEYWFQETMELKKLLREILREING